jgi:hypothetical protein
MFHFDRGVPVCMTQGNTKARRRACKNRQMKAAMRECFRAEGVQVARIGCTIKRGVGTADVTAQEK